ncbi:MAG: hypothetical protein LBS98_07440 [Coriobacteriales bacterium]|jgi:putative ABC transport system permease protein|nr:hypothetical protein [Coriobacteriales bacterium]
MFLRVLKKDLLRKKTMNVVLLLLIALSATFAASSVSNMVTVNNALDYFAQESNLADYYLILQQQESDIGAIDDWMASSDAITNGRSQEYLLLTEEKVTHDGKEVWTNSGGLSFTTVPVDGDYVFADDKRIEHIAPGEIALSYSICEHSGLELGDTITVTSGDTTCELTVTYVMKDMLFGSDFIGFNRAILSETDYRALADEAEAGDLRTLYSLSTDDMSPLLQEKNALSYAAVYEFEGSLLRSTFYMEIITFSLLIIVAVVLMAIAFVLLHFAISFTIQEDYREIGIMKGIGVSAAAIKGLYAFKYVCIAVVGAGMGFLASLPFSGILLGPLNNTLLMGDAQQSFGLRIVCALFVVLLILAFVWLGTHKVQKLTAIQAIRGGATGERYVRKGLIHLATSTRISTVSFLAVNDIFSGLRNYLSLTVALVLGITLVVLPANAANTLKSDGLSEYFALGTPDVVIDNKRYDTYVGAGGLQRLEQDMQEMEEEFAQQGVALTLDMRYQYNVKVYVDDPTTARHIVATHYMREGETGLAALEGSAPHLGNEIAMTRMEMEVLGVEVGDRVQVVLGSTDRAYLITGSYENMINLGLGLTFSTQLPPDSEAFGEPAGMTGTFVDRDAVPAQIEQLKEAYPSYTLWTAREFITSSIGDIYGTITGVKNMILVLVFGVNLLVVMLLSKTLLARNRGEIALLKSLGFANGALVRWQVTRMALVAVAALVVGLLLASALNPAMVRLTFGLMGAPNIPAVIEPLETFVLYPALLLAGTVVAVFLSVLSLRGVDKRAFDAIE